MLWEIGISFLCSNVFFHRFAVMLWFSWKLWLYYVCMMHEDHIAMLFSCFWALWIFRVHEGDEHTCCCWNPRAISQIFLLADVVLCCMNITLVLPWGLHDFVWVSFGHAVVETLVIFQQTCPVHILLVLATGFVFVAWIHHIIAILCELFCCWKFVVGWWT